MIYSENWSTFENVEFITCKSDNIDAYIEAIIPPWRDKNIQYRLIKMAILYSQVAYKSLRRIL